MNVCRFCRQSRFRVDLGGDVSVQTRFVVDVVDVRDATLWGGVSTCRRQIFIRLFARKFTVGVVVAVGSLAGWGPAVVVAICRRIEAGCRLGLCQERRTDAASDSATRFVDQLENLSRLFDCVRRREFAFFNSEEKSG